MAKAINDREYVKIPVDVLRVYMEGAFVANYLIADSTIPEDFLEDDESMKVWVENELTAVRKQYNKPEKAKRAE